MPAITFLDRTRLAAIPLQVHRHCGDSTLMEIIMDSGLPHDFICEEGHCGGCVVKVVTLKKPGQSTLPIHLGDFERETLYGLGKLSRQQYASPILSAHIPLWRLACQYRPEENDIIVAL